MERKETMIDCGFMKSIFDVLAGIKYMYWNSNIRYAEEVVLEEIDKAMKMISEAMYRLSVPDPTGELFTPYEVTPEGTELLRSGRLFEQIEEVALFFYGFEKIQEELANREGTERELRHKIQAMARRLQHIRRALTGGGKLPREFDLDGNPIQFYPEFYTKPDQGGTKADSGK